MTSKRERLWDRARRGWREGAYATGGERAARMYLLLWLAVILALIGVGLAGHAAINSGHAAREAARAAAVTRRANDLAIRRDREAAFRLCARATVSNAERILSSREDVLLAPPGSPARAGLERRAERAEARLPLLDCTPNFKGFTAIKLNRRETERFLRFYSRHGVAPEVRFAHVYMRPGPPIVGTLRRPPPPK